MSFEAIILDTETTDVENAEVIELYWEDFTFGAPAGCGSHQFYYPKGEIALGALCAHHIFKEDLLGSPPASQAPGDVGQSGVWIGHNVDFDWKMLGMPPVQRVCTLAMARSIWPKLDKHTLTALVYFLQGRTPEIRTLVHNAHGAKADVTLCRAVLERILDIEGIKSVNDLVGFSDEARIPKIMSFGKYKGQPISAVDRGWANWYQRESAKSGDCDQYLMTALRKAGKL